MPVRLLTLWIMLLWAPLLQAVQLEKKPLKTYFAKLEPLKDKQKVLAAHSPSGWTIANNLIVGPHNDRFVGAFEFEGLAPKWWLPSEFDVAGPLNVYGQFTIVSYRDGSLKGGCCDR